MKCKNILVSTLFICISLLIYNTLADKYFCKSVPCRAMLKKMTKPKAGDYVFQQDSTKKLSIDSSGHATLIDSRYQELIDNGMFPQLNKDTISEINRILTQSIESFGYVIRAYNPVADRYFLYHYLEIEDGLVLTGLKERIDIANHFTAPRYYRNLSTEPHIVNWPLMKIRVVEPIFDTTYYINYKGEGVLSSDYNITVVDLFNEVNVEPDTRVYAGYSYKVELVIEEKIHRAFCMNHEDYKNIRMGSDSLQREVRNKILKYDYFMVIGRFNPIREDVNRAFGYFVEGQVQSFRIYKTKDYL